MINLVLKGNNMYILIYKACQSCKYKQECCKNRSHRSITRYGHALLDKCGTINGISRKYS